MMGHKKSAEIKELKQIKNIIRRNIDYEEKWYGKS